MKTKLILPLLILLFLYTGCTRNNESVDTSNTTVSNNDINQELIECKKENEYLEKENTQLKNNIEKLKSENTEFLGFIENSNKLKKVHSEHSFLKFFAPSTQWDELIVSNGIDEVVIKDRELLASLAPLFYIDDVKNPEPPGSRNINSYYYKLIKNDIEIAFEILYDNVIIFNDIENIIFTSSRDISQIGKAFLKQPEYYPEDNVFTQMFNSGMYITKNKSNKLTIFNSFLIQHTIDSFLRMEKESIEEEIFNKEEKVLVESWEFYSYGKIISMVVYTNYVKVIADNQYYYYKINNQEALQQLLYIKSCY